MIKIDETEQHRTHFHLNHSIPPFPVDPVDLEESEKAADEDAKPEHEEDSTNIVKTKLAHLHQKRFSSSEY